MRQASAILTGDIHLREDTPTCRTDDFFAAQEKKIEFLYELQKEHNCEILDAGDLFHKYKSSPFLLKWAIENMPDIVTVPGNHDLPAHNLDDIHKSDLGVLYAAGVATVLAPEYDESPHICGLRRKTYEVWGFPWGKKIKPPTGNFGHRKVALNHVLTYTGRRLWPGMKADGATKILKANPDYDLIVTGHNHLPFAIEYEGRWLVNPGSLTRQTADQIDHKPRVYLWYEEDNTVEPVYLPVEKDVISREHIDKKNERDERIESFIARLNDDMEVGLSFESNLEKFFETNKVHPGVRKKVWEAVEV